MRDLHQHPEPTLGKCSRIPVIFPEGNMRQMLFYQLYCFLFLHGQQHHEQTILSHRLLALALPDPFCDMVMISLMESPVTQTYLSRSSWGLWLHSAPLQPLLQHVFLVRFLDVFLMILWALNLTSHLSLLSLAGPVFPFSLPELQELGGTSGSIWSNPLLAAFPPISSLWLLLNFRWCSSRKEFSNVFDKLFSGVCSEGVVGVTQVYPCLCCNEGTGTGMRESAPCCSGISTSPDNLEWCKGILNRHAPISEAQHLLSILKKNTV